MNVKLILLGCILASIAVTQIVAQCLCGAQGEDYCSCSATRVPRPQQLDRIRSLINARSRFHQFKPVGDRCSCGNSVVEPANRPPCNCQKRTSEVSESFSESLPESYEPASDCGQTVPASFDSVNLYTNHIKKEDYHSLIPADPVSMSLAYQNAHRAAVMVPEEKLAYGFKKLPANAEINKPVPNIPEEKLYSFDGKIVELKDVPCRRYKKKEEYEDEEEEEEEEETKQDCGLGYLNYNQLGYYPEMHHDHKFIIRHSDYEIDDEPEAPCSGHEHVKEIGNCGYRPGRVVDVNNDDDELRAFLITNDDDQDQAYNYEGIA